MFDYSKLRGKIREVFHTESDFAVKAGISKQTLSAKLNGKVEFTQNEINNFCNLLGIDVNEIRTYFFTEKVQ